MIVSVVMSTYNGEAYIEEQLDSVCVQLGKADELIICDDCSTDKTVEIIRKYFDIHTDISCNVQIIENETNIGFQNNFKKAMELSSGEYIFFSDQDDIWLENKIEIMIDFMNQNPDCKLLCSDYEPFRTTTNAPIPPKSVIKRMPNNGAIEKVAFLPANIYLKSLGCCMCMRSELKEMMKNVWFDKWPHDDRCWRVALCADGLYIIHLNLVKHRIHDSNTATYGNYHNLIKRINHLEYLINAGQIMKELLHSEERIKDLKIIEGNIKCLNARVKWLKKKSIIDLIKMLKYIRYFEVYKSFFVDIYITFKDACFNNGEN